MPVESTTDRTIFFNTNEFAVAATYTPVATGIPLAVTVIYNKPIGPVASDFDLGLSVQAHTALLRKDEVAAPKRGDSLDIGSDMLKVASFALDNTGEVWELDLD